MTALILGCGGLAWFGWGRADAAGFLDALLAAGVVVAGLVAAAGGALAWRSPASTGVLHERAARRRYGIIVAVEFGAAGAGAALLAGLGLDTFVPAWVCAIVGVHLVALARVLADRRLVPLGTAVAAVAVAALVVGLTSDVTPGMVTGTGAGLLLTAYASWAAGTRWSGEHHDT
jgi:hypothetical protein